MKKSYDLHLLKTLLPAYLQKVGVQIFKETENTITAACPIHGGTKDNFHAKQKEDGTWVYVCRSGCGGVGGTVIDLHAALHDLPNKGEAIAGAAEMLGVSPIEPADYQLPSRKERRERAAKQSNRQARQQREAENQEKLTQYLNKSLHQKLAPYVSEDWRADLWHSSPIWTDTPEDDPSAFLRTLFPLDAIVWMGKPKDSGQAHHAARFRTVIDWLKEETLPARIAAGIFRSGSISRSLSNVEASPFIVVESDDLIGRKPTNDTEREINKAMSYALAGYCQDQLGLHLRAVIDTGNKSLHLWFDRPPPDELAAIKELAPGLRIDTGLLDSCDTAPLRMPSCIHDKTNQSAKLIYLSHE